MPFIISKNKPQHSFCTSNKCNRERITLEEIACLRNVHCDPNWVLSWTITKYFSIISAHSHEERSVPSPLQPSRMCELIRCYEKKVKKIKRNKIDLFRIGLFYLLTEEEIKVAATVIKGQYSLIPIFLIKEGKWKKQEETWLKKLKIAKIKSFIYNHTVFESATGVRMDSNHRSSRRNAKNVNN